MFVQELPRYGLVNVTYLHHKVVANVSLGN